MVPKPKPKPDVPEVTPVAVVKADEMVKTTHEAAISIWKNTVFWNTVIGAIVTIVLGYFQTRLKQSVDTNTVEAKKSAAIAQESASVFVKRTEAIEESTTETLHWVNSAMGFQLGLNAESRRRIAELTKDPVDIDIAERAERKYADHVENQRKLDAEKAKGAK